MKTTASKSLFAALLVVCPLSLHAQPAASVLNDPLLRMAAAQPSIDVSTPVVVTATFDPPVVAPGEKSIYRITVNALEAAIQLPDSLPVPARMTAHLDAHGQISRFETNIWKPITTFNFEVRANRSGMYFIPAFLIGAYGKPVVVPETFLDVMLLPPGEGEKPRQLTLQPAVTNVFVGEPLNVRVLYFIKGNAIDGVSQIRFNGDGFLSGKNAANQVIELIEHDGRQTPAFIYETSLMPLVPGQLKLSVQGFNSGMQFDGPVSIRAGVSFIGGTPEYLLLHSEPVTINVRSLPAEGKLPGFIGAIGEFTANVPTLPTNRIHAGDPVELMVTIRGTGDLNRFVPPSPPRSPTWQIFEPVPVGMSSGGNGAEVQFKYTLIPLKDGPQTTPFIPFSYFDPKKAAYVDATIPSIAVTVLPSELPMGTGTPLAGDDVEHEKPARFSALATSPGTTIGSLRPLQLRPWFPLAQIAPAVLLCALWFYARRREYLELHPEIRRRREARRALHRQKKLLNRALARNNTSEFIQSAVGAMQVASAPHFPAHPRALVCADVLHLLNGHGPDARQTVEQFFAAADADRFSITPERHAKILELKPALDEILARLEERL